MNQRNIPALTRTLKKAHTAYRGNPAAQSAAQKVLLKLGLIKPQQRAGALAQLKKLLK